MKTAYGRRNDGQESRNGGRAHLRKAEKTRLSVRSALHFMRWLWQAAKDYGRIAAEYIRDGIVFLIRWRGMCLIVAVVILYTSGVWLVCKAALTPGIRRQAEQEYQEKLDAYKTEQAQAAADEEAREAEQARREAEEEGNIRKTQAEKLAVAMYEFRFNSKADIITACWCFFNRVDIKTGEYAYLSTLEEVIEQPGQWMGYNAENDVLTELFDIAYEQLCVWKDGGHRPVSSEFVFLVWSPYEIHLIDSLKEKNPRTWRYRG